MTILCLSDLHLVKGMPGEDALDSLKRKLSYYVSSHPEWKPDFIAVAGDLVKGSETANDRYLVPSIILDQLLNTFGLCRYHIIAVPGNHDKEVPEEHNNGGSREFNFYLSKFSQSFLETVDQDRFTGLFSHFESFANFYKPFVDVDSEVPREVYHYDYYRKVFDNDNKGAKYTSGLKVFEREKICFLSINTEWTYHRGEMDKPRGENGPKVRICAPIVHYSLNQILCKYSDFLVITLMHRNPAGFSWSERNLMYNCHDIIQDIYRYSDIILTGHDHNLTLLPPDKMANMAQLFRIGSSSRSDHPDEMVPYNAALLRIDPFTREVQVNNCSRQYGVKDGWVIEDLGKYSLRPMNLLWHNDDSFFSENVLSVSSLKKESIESALRAVMGNSGGKLLVFSVEDLPDSIEEIVINSISRNDLTYLVLYCLDESMVPRANEIKQTLKVFFSQALLSIKLVITVILVKEASPLSNNNDN